MVQAYQAVQRHGAVRLLKKYMGRAAPYISEEQAADKTGKDVGAVCFRAAMLEVINNGPADIIKQREIQR